jgi:hypothetical protein
MTGHGELEACWVCGGFDAACVVCGGTGLVSAQDVAAHRNLGHITAEQWNALLEDIYGVYPVICDDSDEPYASIAGLVGAYLSEECHQGEQRQHYGFDVYTAEQAMQVAGALEAWYPEIALPLGSLEDIASVEPTKA